MSMHRWWLALVAALLTPWIGPHVDRYLPIGWLLVRIGSETPDTGFWTIAALLLALGYVVWLLILTGVGSLISRAARRKEAP